VSSALEQRFPDSVFLRNTKGERARFKKANLGNRNWAGWVHLQSYGKAPAVLVSDLKVGDYILYNYGYKSQVKSITPKGKASVVVETESAKDGKLYDRTYRLKSLIPILSDRQIQIHQRLKSKGYAAETFEAPVCLYCPSRSDGVITEIDDCYCGFCFFCGEHDSNGWVNHSKPHPEIRNEYGNVEEIGVCDKCLKNSTLESNEKGWITNWHKIRPVKINAYEIHRGRPRKNVWDFGKSRWVKQYRSETKTFGADEEFYEEYPAKYYQIDEDEGVFHLPATDSYWLVHGEDALTKEKSQKLSFGAEAGTYRINWNDGEEGVTFDYEGGDDMDFDDTWTDLFWDASNPQVKKDAESFNAVVIAPEQPKGSVEKALMNHYLFQESAMRQALMEIENRVELGMMSVEEAERKLNRLIQHKMRSENYASENTSKKLLSGVFMLVAVASLWRAVTVTEDTYLFPKENKYMTILGSASIGLGILAWKGDSILAALED